MKMSPWMFEATADAPATGFRLYRKIGKRLLDIFLAIVMLPALLPMIAILWLWVRADGGPGFFVQPRIGRNGRIFNCWKLRTMVVDAESVLARMCASDPARANEWLINQKLRHDPRITRAGRFLRATSLDELPQIFNVLRGDMSLVGPRPFLPDQEAIYREAGGHGYYHLRPGITGIWQVEGRNTTSFAARVGFDNRYNEAMSLGRDLVLIAKTALIVLKRTGR